jgi:hypothetical protein
MTLSQWNCCPNALCLPALSPLTRYLPSLSSHPIPCSLSDDLLTASTLTINFFGNGGRSTHVDNHHHDFRASKLA